MKARQLKGRDLGLGGALVVLGAAVAIQTTQISSGFSYDNVGPRAVPYIIAAGLLLSGVSIVVGAYAAAEPEFDRSGRRPDWVAVAVISLALLAQMFTLEVLGWIPVATAAFAVVSWAFGARSVLLNILYGLLLAIGTFLLFNYGLGLRLPMGQFP
jgi:putative tricarboxylic transport membrane protein